MWDILQIYGTDACKKEKSQQMSTDQSVLTDEKHLAPFRNKKTKQQGNYMKKRNEGLKMSYDRKTDWRLYFIQFTHIANNYRWAPTEKT